MWRMSAWASHSGFVCSPSSQPPSLPPWTLSDTCFWVPWANKSTALTARGFYKQRPGFKVVGSSRGPQTWE